MKTLFVNIIVSIISLIFFLGLLEIGSRIYFRNRGTLNEYAQRIEDLGYTKFNKRPGEIRVFVVGESAVEGIPYSIELAFPAFMDKLLTAQGAEEVEVINVGIKGRHSFYQRESAKTLIKYGADAVIIYAGNNDTRDVSNVIRDVPFALLDFNLTGQSRFYAGFKRKFLALMKKINSLSGRHVFDINYNQDDVWHWTDAYIRKKREYLENSELGMRRKSQALQDMEKNLGVMIQAFLSAGVEVYIADLALHHMWPPDISDSKIGIGPRGKGYVMEQKVEFVSEGDRKDWWSHYGSGSKALEDKSFEKALTHFERAYKINKTYPMLVHRMGVSLQQLGQYERAKKMYEEGKRLEVQSPGGCPGKNRLIRRLAERFQIPFVPIQETLESFSDHGIVGKELLLDNCHFNVLGNKIVAARIMQSLCEEGFVKCDGDNQWQSWLKKIGDVDLNPENLAREYLAIGFYLMQGTEWSQEPDYERALFYLEKAYELDPNNDNIASQLAIAKAN